MEELKLIHIQLSPTSDWYWKCPICYQLIAPHPAGSGKGKYVLQSKGVATKHLIRHNAGYVPKREDLSIITSKNQYFCNKCNAPVHSKKIFIRMRISEPPKWQPGHRFMCVFCAGYLNWELGLKTKNEVHRGRTKNDGTMGR